MRKLLLVSIFCAGFSYFSNAQAKVDCNGFEVSFKVKKERPGDEVSTVQFEAKGTREIVKYIFFKDTGELVSRDYENSVFRGVEAGNYLAVVVTVSGCRRELQIVIE